MADKIELSKAFIEQELPAAPPLYVSIYLMTQVVGRDSAKVAEKLNATESDVLRAWAYWMDRKVMQKEEEKPAEPPAPPEPSVEEKLLTEIRDLLKK